MFVGSCVGHRMAFCVGNKLRLKMRLKCCVQGEWEGGLLKLPTGLKRRSYCTEQLAGISLSEIDHVICLVDNSIEIPRL